MTRTAQRSDTHIFADARHVLDLDPSVPATVRVHVENGTLTLTGMARRVAERARAEALAAAVPGVGRVVNHIMVAERADAIDLDAPEPDVEE